MIEEIVLGTEASKSRRDEKGKQIPAPFADDVESAVLGEGGKIFFRGRRPVEAGRSVLEFVAGGFPKPAGIDPFHLILDRHPGGNTVDAR